MADDPYADPYAVLGLDPTAAPDDIRRAWLELARRHHPDHGGDPAAMQRVNEAWAVVGDPVRRRAWDREHGRGTPPPGTDDEEVDEQELDLDLLDARPLVAPRRSPVDLLPVALFAASIATACLALAFDSPPMLGMAAFVFFLSCLAVGAVAMLMMRRGIRAGRR
jgi:curved DNA-binding protein CbpA